MWEDGALCPGYANNINSCVDETLEAYRLAQYNISSSAAGKFPYCLKLLPCQYMYKHCGGVPEKNTFPISYMNEGTGTEHFRSTMQKESQFLLLCCWLVELYHPLTLHPVHQVYLCCEGNYYLWVWFTIWGFIGSMSVGSWVVARLARSRAIYSVPYFEHVSIVEGEGGYGIISPTSTVGWLRWGWLLLWWLLFWYCVGDLQSLNCKLWESFTIPKNSNLTLAVRTAVDN